MIVQTHVQEYRLEAFTELHRRCRVHLQIWSGEESFTPTNNSPAEGRPWHKRTRNYFFFGKRLLWQTGLLRAALSAEICILEHNPRILSNWLILLLRRMVFAETVVWGHLFPRSGEFAHTRIVRSCMLHLATQINIYTHAELEHMRKLYPKKKANVSPNAVMWAKECVVGEGRRFRLLFVARLIEQKKPLLLLEAFALATTHIPREVKLDFIGSGPLEADLKARVIELGLCDRVTIHGAIYKTHELESYYSEAIAAFSPGFVGLSATQAFGFGVPLLYARDDLHSVEISLCEHGFNSDYFASDSPLELAKKITEYVLQTPLWAKQHEAIRNKLVSSYTLDHMCDGFMRIFARAMVGFDGQEAPLHVGIAWIGFPYYAARVVQEAQRRHPKWRFTLISSRDGIPYRGIDEMIGGGVHWIDSRSEISWADLRVKYPDIFIITSWPHTAFRALAKEAKAMNGAPIVTMVDNYLRYTPRQLLGYLYFRARLSELFSAVWVPGKYSRRFIEFLGVAPDEIYEGLYAADHDVFKPPTVEIPRCGLIYAGQLIPRKGLRVLIKSLQALEQGGGKVDTCFVGQGAMQSEILNAGFVVHGFQQPAALAVMYQRATAMILPSHIDHWGVAAHEAALCGCLLLVTTQCGCSAELVSHRVNGYIMDSCSEVEIIGAIRWLESLSEKEIALGRQESLRLASAISPARWADTLDQMIERFVPSDRRELLKDNGLL